MYSRGHAAISALLGIVLAFVAPAGTSPVLPVVYAVGLGVGVDFDHFLVARLNRGDWANVRVCLRDPSQVFTDQSEIFAPGDLSRDQRLLSHALIGGGLVALLWPVSTFWALVSAVTLYVHVVCDLVADVRTREDTPDRVAS